MADNPLIIDTELRKDPKTLQPKVIYAGDVWADQPYLAIQQSGINISASKPNGISITDKFGTTIGGPISFSTMPDQISMGGGYWRFNPLLLSCIPSTTPTPVPMLVKSTPKLLAAKDDLSSARNNIVSNSNARMPVTSGASQNTMANTNNTTSSPATTPVPNTAITVPQEGTPPPPATTPTKFTIGGTVAGLIGAGFILQNNAGDNITVSANGTFTFPTSLISGSIYNVSILSQLSNPIQFCTITNGSGTVSGNVINIQITCVNIPEYIISGTISGYAGTGLVLQNNGGNNLTISSNGTFTFSSQVLSGSVYNVTILTSPSAPAQTCTITNGAGIATSNVTNITVVCRTIELLETTTLSSITQHNTSAFTAYNKTNFPLNFTGTTWINNTGTTASVNSNISDDSLNAITPSHVSPVSIKTMIPGYTGKWYAHVNPWFGSSSHTGIGLNDNSLAWVQASTLDQQARGFDGIIIDWYGQGSYEDSVTLLIKNQVAGMPSFTYAIMIDSIYTTTAQLETILTYIKNTYFGTAGYQTHNGTPVLYFWGTPVAGVDYTTALASIGTTVYTVMQGPGSLSNSYINACFDWVQPYGSGVPGGDPYNATDANSYLSSVHSSSKGSMPCLSPGFNGYLTTVKESGYKKGYILNRDFGKCWTSQAAVIGANIPTNIIGIQVATWCDWEEGSAIESPIDNGITVTANIVSNTLSWSVSGGTGDERTISSYELIATYDGINVAVLGTQNVGGSRTFNLNSIIGWGTVTYTIYVIAVGISCVRNQISNAVSYTQ